MKQRSECIFRRMCYNVSQCAKLTAFSVIASVRKYSFLTTILLLYLLARGKFSFLNLIDRMLENTK